MSYEPPEGLEIVSHEEELEMLRRGIMFAMVSEETAYILMGEEGHKLHGTMWVILHDQEPVLVRRKKGA